MLHAVRILGFADPKAVAGRFGLEPAHVEEILLDDEAYGWVQRSVLAETSAWSLTDAGRRANERLLAAELDGAGLRGRVVAAHAEFVLLNTRFLEAITKWQIRPQPGDPMAANDHTDWRWDDGVLVTLSGLGRRLRPVGEQLADGLTRFSGYPHRYAQALARADAGQRRWVDGPGIDSAHIVWFQLHEDLLATLGLNRDEHI